VIVVKVGGSLFDHAGFGPAIRHWLGQFREPVMLVAGGGLCADAVRTYDRIHGLGEERSHWLALRAMAVMSEILGSLIGEMPNVTLFDACAFCKTDPLLPHAWSVTSDSIAARIAEHFAATRLILLKSVDRPTGMTWPEASKAGLVDEYFPNAVANLTCPVEWLNFRSAFME
jgi:aspartokinase-like uncharacterized kinase